MATMSGNMNKRVKARFFFILLGVVVGALVWVVIWEAIVGHGGGPDRSAGEWELVEPPRPILLLHTGGTTDEIRDAVIRSGKPVDEISVLGGTLLAWAVAYERREVVEWLLQQGASPDGIHPSWRPLAGAMGNDDIEMIRLLMQHGADPDLKAGDTVIRDLADREKDPAIKDAIEGAIENEPEAESRAHP